MSRSLRIAILLSAIALVGGLAAADEVIKFKNGHTLVVRESRVEEDTIFLTLVDGSVLGVPKNLLEEVPEVTRRRTKRSGPTNRVATGRGPRGEDLIGYRRAIAAQGGDRPLAQGSITHDQVSAGKTRQVGYLRPGPGVADPIQNVGNKRKGVDIFEARNRARGRAKAPGRAAAPAEAQGGPTVSARMAPAMDSKGRLKKER